MGVNTSNQIGWQVYDPSSPVLEREHDGQQSSACVRQTLVATRQEQDLVLRQSSTKQTENIHDSCKETEREREVS